MPILPIDLNTLDELYVFVESTIPRTGFILEHEAIYCPWARSVSSSVPEVSWLYPQKPLDDLLIQHIGNFAHATLNRKGFVLIERGRVIKAIDVDSVDGSAQPHRLANIVRAAFEKSNGSGKKTKIDTEHVDSKNPFSVIGATESDSDEEIKKKYKRAVMEYHPDRVAHLGQELRDLASRKSKEINEAYAFIRRIRKL